MKLSDPKIKNSFLANSPLYSLLAIFMPLTILISLLLFVEAIMSLELPLFLHITVAFLSAAAASLYSDFMKDAKTSLVAANIRGSIILLFVSYLVSSLLNPGINWGGSSILELFGFNKYNIPASACVIYMWINVITLKQLFSERKRFETYTEVYKGDALKSVLSTDTSLLVFTNEKLTKTRHNYLVQLCIIAVVTLMCAIFNIIMPMSLYVLLLVIFVSAVCVIGFFGIIRWEIYFAGEGISISAPDRTKRVLAMIVFTLICLLAAIIPASDNSILPFSAIVGFFVWLFSKIRFQGTNELPQGNNELIMGIEVMEQGLPFEQAPVSEFWEKFMNIVHMVLRYGIIIFIVGCFLWFMISPLINRVKASGKLTFMQKLVKIVAEWLKGTLFAIISFFADLKEGKALKNRRRYSNEEINRAAASLFSVYSPAKKRDIRRSITLFAKLIIWGDDVRKTMWQPSHAPGEYCSILAAAVKPDGDPVLQKLNEGIIRIGELFGKALYSAEILTGDEQKEFKNLVEEVTSSDK